MQALARARDSSGTELTILVRKNRCSRDSITGVRKSSDKEIKSPIRNNPRSIIFLLYVDLLFKPINILFQISSLSIS